MKTITKITFATITAAALLGILPQRAGADDKTWADVGKVLTGFVIADMAFNHSGNTAILVGYSRHTRGYSYGIGVSRVPVYVPPPPPPPMGYYETRYERVWVDGYYRTIETPAVFDWVWDGCRYVWAQVRPACRTHIWVPGYWTTREVKVWVPVRGYGYCR